MINYNVLIQLSNMENLELFENLRIFLTDENGHFNGECKFKPELVDGSFLINIYNKYGFNKLKEIIGYHMINHQHNLLQVTTNYDTNKLIEYLKIGCRLALYNYENYFSFLEVHPFFHTSKKYSIVLEYFINNYETYAIEYLIEHMSRSASREKIIYNHINNTFSYAEDFADYNHVIIMTILKVMFENFNEKSFDNCKFIIDKYSKYEWYQWKDMFLVLYVLGRKTNNILLIKYVISKQSIDFNKLETIYSHFETIY